VNISIRKLIKVLIGFFGLPLALIYGISFFYILKDIPWFAYPNFLLIAGFVLYGVFFSVMKERSFAYVLGHELMHALTSMLFGGRLVSIFVSHRNGSVKTTKDNFLISLSPYCVPFYATALTLLYYFMSIFTRTASFVPVFVFLLGYALSHHIFFTIHYLKMGQSDLRNHGVLFSFVLIVILNVLIIIAILNIFVPDVPVQTFWRSVNYGVRKIYLYRP
jgi:hypothetical protein